MARVIHTGQAQKAGGQTATSQLVKPTTHTHVQKGVQQQKENVQQTKGVSQLEAQSLALKQKQSQEMVQIMLHVSFGTLFYLRELLPVPCFEDRDLLRLCHRDTHISYDDFIGNNPNGQPEGSSLKTPVSGRRGQPLKVLVRGRDQHSDAIIDLFENGIFEALEKNVLEAVQLTVFVDKDAPSNVLESYTFSFKYAGASDDVTNRLSSISLEQTGLTADMKTTRSAKLGLEMIVRRLITLSTFLPLLPNKRFLGVHLFYSDDCPSNYEPPGFSPATDENLIFPHDEGWTKESQSCGTMNSAFHSVGLKVSSLKWLGPDEDESAGIKQIPDDIQYSATTSREEDIGIEEEGVCQVAQSEPSSSQQSTQTRQDTVAKKMLQKMVPDASSTPDSALVPTQAVEDSLGSMVPGDTIARFTRPQLSQAKLSRLEKQYARATPVCLRRETRSSEGGSDGVQCQCGWNNDEGDMIQCVFCQSRQHLLCYGYARRDDPKIPDTHVCYKCLLEPNEAPLLCEMGTLVLLRRALRVIIEEGYPHRIRDFSQKLHCNGQTIVQVTDLLNKQGLIQATPNSKRKGFTQTGLPKYRIPDSPKVRERLQQEIFDPFVKISHHVSSNSPSLRTRVKINNMMYQYIFSGASQLGLESSMLSVPTQLSPAQTDSAGGAPPGDSQLSFVSDVPDTHGPRARQQHSATAGNGSGDSSHDSGFRNAGFGHMEEEGEGHGNGAKGKRASPGTKSGCLRQQSTSVPRQTRSRYSTEAMDTTCESSGGQGKGSYAGGGRAVKRRRMSNATNPVEVDERSDGSDETDSL
ncbi:DNA binding protein [Arachnomyces sp. PD_36]|nr:DNA binding protein [Arachnomyces sp. PD_36]